MATKCLNLISLSFIVSLKNFLMSLKIAASRYIHGVGVAKDYSSFNFLIGNVKYRHLITQGLLDTNDCSLVRKFILMYGSHWIPLPKLLLFLVVITKRDASTCIVSLGNMVVHCFILLNCLPLKFMDYVC